MSRLLRKVRSFVYAESGATATEYALVVALIILVCITAVAVMGEKVSGSFVEAEANW